MPRIDPRLFGGTELDPQFVPEPPAIVQPAPLRPPVQVPVSTLPEFRNQQEARALHESRDREEAGFWASMGAGMQTTWTAAALAAFEKPHFVPDDTYDQAAALEQFAFPLTPEELTFFQKARSQEEANWAKGRIEHLREASQIASDSALGGFVGAVVGEPALLGIGGGALQIGRMARLGRAATGAVGGVGSAALGTVAQEAAPITDAEVIAGSLLEFGATAMVHRAGRLTKRDPDYPDEVLENSVRNLEPGKVVEDITDPPLPPRTGAQNTDLDLLEKQRDPTWLERNAAWNVHNSLARANPVEGEAMAGRLVDNNRDLSGTSWESQKRAILSDLTGQFRIYEDLFKAELAKRGAGLWQRITNFGNNAYRRQTALSQEVRDLMFRREQAARRGIPLDESTYSPEIRGMADALDKVNQTAAQELRAAGVRGADDLVETPGWVTRRWSTQLIEDMQEAIVRSGRSQAQSLKIIKNLVAASVRRANGWDKQLSKDIAGAIVDRAVLKGEFLDNGKIASSAAELRQWQDLLVSSGVTGERLERAMQRLAGEADDAGRPSYLKNRIDLDYDVGMNIGGRTYRVQDLMDPDINSLTERYLNQVAGAAGAARVGLGDDTALNAFRKQYLDGIKDVLQRGKMARLFDDVVEDLSGRPAGEQLSDGMRVMAAAGRMMSLSMSGLWQVTEWATAAAKYGLVKTTAQAIKEMPLFRQMWGDVAKDPRFSTRLNDILARHSEQDLRIRPYARFLADNFEVSPGAAMQLRMQQAEQLVPYMNVMRHIHTWQARATANLVVDRLVQAAVGDAKAMSMLQRYGLKSEVIGKLKGYSTDTKTWPDGLWAELRPGFKKMMDEAVLYNRIGDMPAFAKYDKLGKFIFTYRSFMLGAHNKLLMGTLSREGIGGVALMMGFQMPLAMLAVQAQASMRGEGTLSMEDAAMRAMGVMGAMGFLSELAGVASGEKNMWGAPGLIPLDRAYALGGAIMSGDLGRAGDAAFGVLPLVQASPFLKALQEHATGD